MKPTTVAFLTAAGMLLTSLTVYSITPPGGFRSAAPAAVEPEVGRSAPLVVARDDGPRPDGDDLSHFEGGSTLRVDGRVGHARLPRGGRGETYVLLEVRGADVAGAGAAAPVNLAIVVDRSGSMRGARLRNALAGAAGAVDRLHEGDVVTVITFDTTTQLVVPPTTLDARSRGRVLDAIHGITLGTDTCISCGLEAAMAELDRTAGRVNRMILLSDGDANRGVRDVAGFRAIGRRAQARGLGVTTIGVDVDYNEKIMTAIAQESNGRHYFVENDADLGRVFAAEAESTTSAVAADAEARIDLGPGVEVVRVLDRSFRREGHGVVVPLGTFARGEPKTVLVEVRVPVDRDGVAPIASVDLTYRDLVARAPGRVAGRLSALVTDPREACAMDPVVSGRVERSATAALLEEANDLVAAGRAGEAERRLRDRAQALAQAGASARSAAPAARAADVAKDFDGQRAAIDRAATAFAAPAATAGPMAAPARATKSAAKRNAESAVQMGF